MTQLPAARETKKPQNIRAMLESPSTVRRFSQIVPRHLSSERMLRIMAHAVYKTPKLAQCNPLTLLGAMQACASLGLEPNTVLGHAYLIPFKQDVTLIIGYKGYIDLARRSGNLASMRADVVYDGDDFDFAYGSDQRLYHRPQGKSEVPVSAYAYARLTDGEAFEALPYAKALSARKYSMSFKSDPKKSPWTTHEHEMVAKTMVRRLAKWLPLSMEFATAAALDAMSDAGKADLSVFADDRVIEMDASAAEIEDKRETVDEDTNADPAGDAPSDSGGENPQLFGEEG